jgi:hypothetical protein
MPLGKWKAYLIVGVIWGLWHAPLIAIGFNYPGMPVLGILMMIPLRRYLMVNGSPRAGSRCSPAGSPRRRQTTAMRG